VEQGKHIDTDFGQLVFVDDVPPARRVELMSQVLQRRAQELLKGAVITVRGGRIRITRGRE
jgi:hypothetical protein